MLSHDHKGEYMDFNLKQDVAVASAKITPAVAGATIAGYTLNEVVALVTIVYVIFQAGVLIHKHYWAIQDRRRKKAKEAQDAKDRS